MIEEIKRINRNNSSSSSNSKPVKKDLNESAQRYVNSRKQDLRRKSSANDEKFYVPNKNLNPVIKKGIKTKIDKTLSTYLLYFEIICRIIFLDFSSNIENLNRMFARSYLEDKNENCDPDHENEGTNGYSLHSLYLSNI